MIDSSDKRWGGYIPWYFRHGDFSGTGNFLLFFERISQRLHRFFYHGEGDIKSPDHFGEVIESKSLQRFRYTKTSQFPAISLSSAVKNFFLPEILKAEVRELLHKNTEYIDATKTQWRPPRSFGLAFRGIGAHDQSASGIEEMQEQQKKKIDEFRTKRLPIIEENFFRTLFVQRLGVLEVILINLPKKTGWVDDLIRDIKMFLVEAQIMLDVNEASYLFEPLEEKILQKEIIDNLMPRLSSRFPERAKEFVEAYHDMIQGTNFDEVFLSAFKTLEEIAKSISGYTKFEFKDSDLKRYFSNLHPTTCSTMIKLAAHRGDEGGHGRNTPEPHEMRYLLFSIINIALLLLDYGPSKL